MSSSAAEDELPWFSVDDYQHAFTRLGNAITPAQRRMLSAHAESLDQTLSVRQLATAGGYATDKATYSQYGHPWKRSTDEERLDPCNGLLLAAHLDALFDSGLITFRVDGTIEISSILSLADQAAWGLSASMKLRRANPGRAKYLAFHREHVFRA